MRLRNYAVYRVTQLRCVYNVEAKLALMHMWLPSVHPLVATVPRMDEASPNFFYGKTKVLKVHVVLTCPPRRNKVL